MSHIKSILVPIDGSPASVAALAEAVELARDLDATVETVHVVAPDESVALFKLKSQTTSASSTIISSPDTI